MYLNVSINICFVYMYEIRSVSLESFEHFFLMYKIRVQILRICIQNLIEYMIDVQNWCTIITTLYSNRSVSQLIQSAIF